MSYQHHCGIKNFNNLIPNFFIYVSVLYRSTILYKVDDKSSLMNCLTTSLRKTAYRKHVFHAELRGVYLADWSLFVCAIMINVSTAPKQLYAGVSFVVR